VHLQILKGGDLFYWYDKGDVVGVSNIEILLGINSK